MSSSKVAVGVAAAVVGGALTALAVSIGVVPKKLIAVDTGTPFKAKVVYVAKDRAVTKGAGVDVGRIGVQFKVFYADGSVAGAFTLPAGPAAGWRKNRVAVAKFKNKAAPAGATEAQVAVIKPRKLLKLIGKGLGDAPLDVRGLGRPGGAGDPGGPVHTAYCVNNAGEEYCHCSEFTGCTWKVIKGGKGAKLACTTGTGDSTCLANRPVCGDGVVEGPETCDPPNTCPVPCDDGDACTTDVSTGSAEQCDATCAFEPITVCQDADGCCLEGCGASDDDCVSGCFVDLGRTVLDTCTDLEWEKKETGGRGEDASNLHDVDNTYVWACSDTLFGLCQPNAAAAAACAAQGAYWCEECLYGCEECLEFCREPSGITTIWDWVAQVNAETFAGHDDWRLATVYELETIVPITEGPGPPPCEIPPCINPIFGPTRAGFYWSGIFPCGVRFDLTGFGSTSSCAFSALSTESVRAVRTPTTTGTTTTTMIFIDTGRTVIDTRTGLQWEKKNGNDLTPDPANLHDVDNAYMWAGCCDGDCSDLANLCQPNAAAEATCIAQAELDTAGCLQCTVGTCDVDPRALGAITTIWDWVNQVNAEDGTGFAGHADWRLPSQAGSDASCPGCAQELLGIVDDTQEVCRDGSGVCIDPIFGPTRLWIYWSATTDTTTGNTWAVYFFSFLDPAPDPNFIIMAPKATEGSVRAVRSGS